MSRISQTIKKSTKKYRDFKISPLIPVVAIIEVLVLIGVSTFAWLTVSSNKSLDSGVISVEADSGLDIDFSTANVDDYINIWNYVDKDFAFEPVTSLDGRNVYVPTSGTFENQETGSMVFREGTVNDINTKYLNIDFELTNTSAVPVDVYLNNKSFFKVKDGNNLEESRALRLAFYTNDGNSGNVGSSLIHNSSNTSTDGADSSDDTDPDAFTVYFDNTSAGWSDVYAYFWDYDDGSSPEYQTVWPGVKMTRVSGKTYSVTITNPASTHGIKYDRLIFTNGDGKQTGNYTLTASSNNKVFKATDSGSNVSGYPKNYVAKTVYFIKPDWWGDHVYCHAFDNTNQDYYTEWPGDEMTYVGSGIYSYTFDENTTGQILFDNGTKSTSSNQYSQTADFSYTANRVYYVNGFDSVDPNKYTVTTLKRDGQDVHYQAESTNDPLQMKYNTVYFFNTYNWTNPYATVTRSTDTTNAYTLDFPMVSLSGNVYYCTVPEFFDTVYFRDKNQGSNADLRTKAVPISDGTVYRPTAGLEEGTGYHLMDTFIYSTYIQKSGYPVISPGVSAGFQRPYSPVINIDSQSGSATEIIPAFSNSIDNYIYGSHTPVFTIEAGHMVSLSMVLWLEGTDTATNGSIYPGNDIALKLEFATVAKYSSITHDEDDDEPFNTGESEYFTYNFYDRTRELWTSNRQSTESGITVAPVMQLYDNTIKRGYLMSPKEYSSYDGQKKVSCWSVTAPQSIAKLGHDLVFRRVNPYDEDEVWNYWHAGRVAGSNNDTVYETLDDAGSTRYDPYSIALDGTNDTISFTAFSDGSPLASMPGVGQDANVPADSCGGLWGNHSVRTVTLYDGIIAQPLDDNDGVMTVNYSYAYMVGNTTKRNVTIEYKASTGDNDFFYFIMPNVAYATQATCRFKQYRNFNSGYAINSVEKNPNITYVNGYGGASCKVAGDYVEITQLTSQLGYNQYEVYWGSDMFYIQTNNLTKDVLYTSNSDVTGARLFQVKFTDDSDSSNKFISLYYNANLKSSDGTGFACVVPNDKVYTRVKLQRASFHGDTIYNETSGIEVHHDNYKDITISDSYTNKRQAIKMNHMNNKGVKTTWFKAKITLQTNMNSSGKKLYLHTYKGGSTNGWPGAEMYWDGSVNSGGTTLYQAHYNDFDATKYNNIIFAYNNGDNQSAGISVSIDNLYSQMIYESKNGYNAGLVGNNGNKETIQTESWSIGSWPHLTFAS